MPFQEWPFSNLHNVNLDWVLAQLQEVSRRLTDLKDQIDHISISTGVLSVNRKTGVVTLNAEDVGALPADTPIPAAVTEQTVAGWGFTKNTGTYSKPSGGIPKTDLAADVQTSLGKADTALQQHQSLAGYATEAWVGQQIANIPDELPSGGSAGDFLRKTSSGAAWQTVPSAESNSFGGGS